MDSEAQKKLAEKARGRQQFKHNDQVVYEWDQNMEDVNIYIKPPPIFLPKVREQAKKQLQPGQVLPELDIKITVNQLQVGIKGNPPFLNEKLGANVVVAESFWMIDDDEIHVQLAKVKKAETWGCACQGHQSMDPLTKQEVQKQILLERFGEEHPGFDFSGAEMNGNVPDAREFMGGVSYK